MRWKSQNANWPLLHIPSFSRRRRAKVVAESFLAKGLLPRKAQTDALHIAISAVYSVDSILSWNFRHLVNESIQKRIGLLLESRGLRLPRVCIPESLL